MLANYFVIFFNATTTIKRSDFGINKYVPAVADTVNIVLQIEATKD